MAIVVLTGCDDLAADVRARLSGDPGWDPSRWETVSVDRGLVRDVVPARGRVRPAREIEIGAEVSGRIIEVNVEFDQRIVAGEVLARIDPEPFQASLARARALLNDAQAAEREAQARLELITLRLERAERLVSEGAGPLSEAEDLALERRAMLASLLRFQARVDLARGDLDQAMIDLDRSVIRSPVDGFVLDRRTEPGQTVNAAFSTPVLFTVAADLEQVVIEARVAETDVARIEPGMEARFLVDAYPREDFRGVAGPLQRAPRVENRFVSYIVEIEAVDEAERLLPGMTASVEFIASEAFNVLRAPREALRPAWTAAAADRIIPPDGYVSPPGADVTLTGAALVGSLAGSAIAASGNTGRNVRYLFVVRDDRLHAVEAVIGAEDARYFQIVDSDLQPGDELFVRALEGELATGPG